MTISDGDILRVSAVLARGGSDAIVNVYHVEATDVDPLLQDGLRQDLQDWMEAIYGLINTRIPISVSYEQIEIFNVTDGGPEPTEPWLTLTLGTAAGDEIPDGVSALSIGRTGVSKVLGKKFWPIFTENQLTDGLFDGVTTTQVAVAAAEWITPFTGATLGEWTPGVWSRGVASFRPFISADGNNIPAYQRRRKRGVGS